MNEEERAQLSSFSQHPDLALLARLLDEKAQAYYTNLARFLRHSKLPVDQREIDEQRGFWKGALWAVTTFPKLEHDRWLESVEKALKESDEEWLTRH